MKNNTYLTIKDADELFLKASQQFDVEAAKRVAAQFQALFDKILHAWSGVDDLGYALHNYDLCKALEADIAAMFGNIPINVKQHFSEQQPDETVVQVCGEDGASRWSFTFTLPARIGLTGSMRTMHYSAEEYHRISEEVLFAMWKDLQDEDDE